MEDFNFSSLTPIQQESSSVVGMVAASPLILPTQQPGCELNSPLLVSGKESDDTTMYITVDTGPPSNIIPLLNSSPSSASYSASTLPAFLTSSLKSDDDMIHASHCNTTIASLIIDAEATGGCFPTTALSSTIKELQRPSTIFVDNTTSLCTATSNSLVSTFSGIPQYKSEVETHSGFSHISYPIPSSESTSPSLFCGECSVNLPSSGDFFEHWVTHHCQLLQPALSSYVEESPKNNVIELTKGPTHDTKNILSSHATNNSSNSTNNSLSTTEGLIMERCSVCNHIFVQGTERYKQHSRLGACVSSTNNIANIAGRHNVNAVNNNNDSASEMRIMVPLNHEQHRIDLPNISENLVPNVFNVQAPPVLPKIPLSVVSAVANSAGIKKRKIGSSLLAVEVPDKNGVIKKQETIVGTTSCSKNCVCGVCNISVKSITSYFLHWLEHHQNDTTFKQQTLPTTPNECTSSTNILQEVWQCRACPSNITKLFPDCITLSNHVQMEHTSGFARHYDEGGFIQQFPPFISPCCHITFQNKESLDKHETIFHGNNVNQENVTNIVNNLSCPLCYEQIEDPGNTFGMSLCNHYRRKHLVKCKGMI